MATLKSLANKLFRLADDLETEARAARDETALVAVRALVAATPVDTTQALSNWRVTASGSVAAYIAAHYPGSRGSTRAASAAKAIADAEDAIAAGNASQALVIFNSLPYIRHLNEGWSAQAPAGFVERALLIARSFARKRKFKVR